MVPATTYRDALTCDECGCFLSRHDDLCSQWMEPDEPIDDDAPIPYVVTPAEGAPEPIAGMSIGA